MGERMNRRDMLGLLGGAAISTAIGGSSYFKSERALAEESKTKPLPPASPAAPKDTRKKVAIARQGDPRAMVDAVVEALGGMGVFVAKGNRVLVKPNIGWDRTPELGANTNPDVVARVVELCLKAGAADVVVFDRPCNDPRRCYVNSGIQAAAKAAGARVVQFDNRRVTEVDLKGEVLRKWKVFNEALKVDVRINVPVAKNHGISGVTLGMKNWMGCLAGDRAQLHQRIHSSVVDLAAWFRPQLTILDAYRIMVDNGPTGGSLTDIKMTKTLCASADPVAVEAFGASLFGLGPDTGYLVMAEERGLGSRDWSKSRVQEIDLKARRS